jgi:hypothetical protein
MRKWLRGWFAWRFSLGRLVIATVVLGVIIGLSLCKIGPIYLIDYEPSGFSIEFRGWPLPFIAEQVRPGTEEPVRICDRELTVDEEAQLSRYQREYWELIGAGLSYQMPLTHLQYRLLDYPSAQWLLSGNGLIFCGIVDLLVMICIPSLILFLQIPRRQAPVVG